MEKQNTAQEMCQETVSGTAKGDAPALTKESLQSLSDAELCAMVEKATGHTGKDFGPYMNCDFSYSYLTDTLKKRGYVNGWYKASEGQVPSVATETIVMRRPTSKAERKNFSICPEIANEWKEFNENVPFPSVTLEYALRRFMDDVRSKRVRFVFEFEAKD